jgi:hypothetical protein
LSVPWLPYPKSEAPLPFAGESTHRVYRLNDALTLLAYTPNPAKVLIIFEELGLPCQTILVDGDDVKKEPFVSINPNGRAPGTTSLPLYAGYFIAMIVIYKYLAASAETLGV